MQLSPKKNNYYNAIICWNIIGEPNVINLRYRTQILPHLKIH